MEKAELLYEGKAKKVYAMSEPNYCMVEYKDDATAFNGLKKGTIVGKGIVNNKMSNFMFKLLEEKGIHTHYVEQVSDRETIVKQVKIVPLEVIIRNKAAGSMAKRLGLEEGTELKTTVLEFSYKDDALGDPLINSYHALALGIATREDIKAISDIAFGVNEALKEIFKNSISYNYCTPFDFGQRRGYNNSVEYGILIFFRN